MTETNPYGFIDQFGTRIDWAGFIGEVAPFISGHNKPITKEELAVICASKQRQNNLVRSIRCMKYAGESEQARALWIDIMGSI